jgi:predicted membrane-bound spermidine synthase
VAAVVTAAATAAAAVHHQAATTWMTKSRSKLMQFSPEAQILILNAVILGVAYLGIYPSLQDKTLNRIMAIDLLLSVLAVTVAAALFWGSGTRFTLLFFNVNWLVFSMVTLFVVEIPLFVHFAQKHGIDLHGPNDD